MSQANGNNSRAASETAPDEGVVSRARIERLRGALPNGDSLVDELIDLFLSDLPKRLTAIAQALECADAAALALQAHALRGGAANFGPSRLDELCAKLEQIGERGALGAAPALLDELQRESAPVRGALLALKSKDAANPAEASAMPRRPRPA